MSRCVWVPILAIIAASLAMTFWGATRNASSPDERQKTLAALFGGWPPTKGNAFLLVAFFGGSILLSRRLCVSR
jgi:hypothetical protein